MKWYKCSEVMPGWDEDRFYNEKGLCGFWAPEFLVIYNYGDEDYFLQRCTLYKGKFETDEWCRARIEGKECPDIYQKSHWDDEIIITHWMRIEWPEE